MKKDDWLEELRVSRRLTYKKEGATFTLRLYFLHTVATAFAAAREMIHRLHSLSVPLFFPVHVRRKRSAWTDSIVLIRICWDNDA